VEILFFDPNEEPDVLHAKNDPETSELYLPGFFMRTPLEPMVSAKAWRASWLDEVARFETDATMVVEAPGAPAGMEMEYRVIISGFAEEIGVLRAPSGDGQGVARFSAWDAPLEPPYAGEMQATQVFPEIFFEFVAEGGGRRVTSRNRIPYRDALDMQLEMEDGGELQRLGDQPYVVATLWGKRRGVTNADGILREAGLPPGGISLILRDTILVDEQRLHHGWDEDER
jgi:hypothetical protein